MLYRAQAIVQSTRCCTEHKMLYRAQDIVQSTRFCTEHKMLYRAQDIVQSTRCCTEHKMLCVWPLFIQTATVRCAKYAERYSSLSVLLRIISKVWRPAEETSCVAACCTLPRESASCMAGEWPGWCPGLFTLTAHTGTAKPNAMQHLAACCRPAWPIPLLQKLTDVWMTKKFIVFYGTLWFIAVCTTGPYYYPEDGGSTAIRNVIHVSNSTTLQHGGINPLKPNDPYKVRTAPLTSKRWILYIYSTNIGTEYFKYGI